MRRGLATVALAVGLCASPAAAQFGTTEVSGPGSGAPLLLTKTSLVFEDLAPVVPDATYNVYRRKPGEGFRCLTSNLTSPAWTGDPDTPVGEVWWYTVVADDGWGENRHGNAVAIDVPCPCSGPAPVTGNAPLRLERLAQLFRPVFLTALRSDPSRLYVCEQSGAVRLLKRGVLAVAPFLTVEDKILWSSVSGLYSLAFHPRYPADPRVFVAYLNPDRQVTIEEYTVAPDLDQIEPGSGRVIFEYFLAGEHYAGQLAFGPRDGYLYMSLGDAGGADPGETSDNLGSLAGKIIRIDIDSTAPPLEYRIPPDNPFVLVPTTRPEIWAYGLRNAWRFSFDRATDELYISDVGQDRREEVNVQPADSRGGEHYGWSTLEGTLCFIPRVGCDPSGKVAPIYEYDHDPGFSVTGGYVYRGCRLPGYHGTYFYADYLGSFVHSFTYAGGLVSDLRDWSAAFPEIANPVSFGEDARGELYLMNHLEGTVYRIVPE